MSSKLINNETCKVPVHVLEVNGLSEENTSLAERVLQGYSRDA